MQRVDIREAERRLSELISEVADGEEVVITRHDGSSFRIVPVERPRPKFGSARGKIETSEDFDEPLEDFETYGP